RFAANLIADANERGNARRGISIFGSAKFACLSCHQVGARGGTVGPALTDVGKRLKPEEIAEAILWPKRHLKPEFIAWPLRMADGRTLQGYKRAETAAALEVFDPTSQKSHSLPKAEIEEQLET